MAWIGSAPNQTYQRTDGVRTGTAVNATAKANGVNDTAVLADARENDMGDAITLCLKKDGGNQPSANLPMNTFRHTGVGAAQARTDYARASQVQDSSLIYGGTAGGTANAITLDCTPSITAYAAGQMFVFKASADNTGATDINIDGVGSANLFKLDGATELAAGDIQENGMYLVLCDGTNFVLVGALTGNLAAINALAVTDGNIIVGNGTTWVAESGATARTSLGLGTGDSPTFTSLTLSGDLSAGTDGVIAAGTIELGHASDTTIARSGSGDITIEGNAVYRAGGTDVAVADGGTGASNASGARTNLGLVIGTDVAAATVGQGKHTVWIPAGAMISRTTNGAASGSVETTTNKVMLKTLDFDASTQEFAQFHIHMPKSWNESTVTFQAVWSHPSTTTNFGVAWQLAGVALSNDDAADTAFGTEQVVTDTGGTTNDIYITDESSAITIGGTPAEGDWVVFQVARVPGNGSDTMAVDARLHGIKLLFTTNAATDD